MQKDQVECTKITHNVQEDLSNNDTIFEPVLGTYENFDFSSFQFDKNFFQSMIESGM